MSKTFRRPARDEAASKRETAVEEPLAAPSEPATADAPAPVARRPPASGGSWIRRPDGTLARRGEIE